MIRLLAPTLVLLGLVAVGSSRALAIEPAPAMPGDDRAGVSAPSNEDGVDPSRPAADGLETETVSGGEGGDASSTDDADQEGHGKADTPPLLSIDFGSAFWSLLIFLGLVFVLGKFVWPKILEGLQSREQKIHVDLVGAENANAEAKKTLAEYERKLSAAQAEARQVVEQARADAEQLKARLAEETEQEMARLRERATEDIQRAKRQALADLSAHAADLAVDVAGRILQRDIEAGDTDRLIQQSLDEMDAGSRN